MRIEFPQRVKKLVAERSGFRCSFPRCDKPTIGPAESAGDSVSTGVACHIYSAAEGGPRGQGNLSPDQLAGIGNALWLCANHARIMDVKRGKDYPPDRLLGFKKAHEAARDRERQKEWPAVF